MYVGDDQIALDTNVLLSEVEDFNDLPIKVGPDTQIRLRDIGRAEDSYNIQKSRVRVNGRRQVYVPVYRQQGASSLAVAGGVHDELPRMEKSDTRRGRSSSSSWTRRGRPQGHRQPDRGGGHRGGPGVGDDPDLPGRVEDDGHRRLVLPLAVLGSIVGLSASGNTINVMTLSGLFLAIGPLVDNAIVVLENTHRHLGLGKNPVRAAFDAASEVSLPVLVATLSTMIVLAPIALTPGLGGFLFKPLALAVAFAMIASYLLAFTVVPAVCSRVLKGHGHTPRRRRADQRRRRDHSIGDGRRASPGVAVRSPTAFNCSSAP